MEKIKAIVFDFDNTLADRSAASYKAYDAYLRVTNPQLEIGSVYRESILQDIMIWDMFGTFDKHFITDNAKRKYGLNCDIDINEWWGENQYLFEELFEDTIETLLYLKEKGYKLAVMTNGPAKSQRAKVTKVGLDQYMDILVVCGEHDFQKPDKRAFDYVCEQLGVENSEAVYVGDIYSNDVLGSYNAGLTPIWLWPDGRRFKNDDTIKINKMSDLRNIF